MRMQLLIGAAVAMLTSPAFAAGDAAAGKRVFSRCVSCHQVGPSARSGYGPHLNDLVGRRAGSVADFNYSPALKASGIVWDEARLRAFIRASGDVAPGNKMRFWWVGSERQLDDLLAYLREAGASATPPR